MDLNLVDQICNTFNALPRAWGQVLQSYILSVTLKASERRELISVLAVLLAHFLKWHYQPSFRGRSWQLTIKEQRRQLQRHLKDNPSLHERLEEFISDAYVDSVLLAAKETGLEESAFPSHCPYTQDDLINPEFYPGLQ